MVLSEMIDGERGVEALGQSLHGISVGIAAGVVIISVQEGAPQWVAMGLLAVVVLLSWLIDYLILGWSAADGPET